MTKPIPPVSKYMSTGPFSIGRDQTLQRAHEMLREHKIRHLPVLEGGQLVGMVTMRDLNLVETLRDVDPKEVTVEDAMSTSVYSVHPDTPMDEVAATMEQSGPFTSRMLVRDDLRVELLWWHDLSPEGDGNRRPMTRLGFTHLSFRVDRIDDLFEAAVRCGGAVWPETMSVLGDPAGPGEPVRLVYLTDPDGTRIEVMSGTPALGG